MTTAETTAAPATATVAPAKSVDPDIGTKLLAPGGFTFTPGEERVKLEIKGENPRTFSGVYAVPAFPLTAPNKMIQLYAMKDDGTVGELAGIVENIDALDKTHAAILRTLIRSARILPIIQRIEKVLDELHSFHWWVITDRGAYDFYTGSPKEAITYTSAGQIVIEDLTGNQFTIMDAKALDSISRAYLERAT
jgi:hypothetical protein